MLASLIRLKPKHTLPPTPEDFFQSSLGTLFSDDIQIQHGDLDSTVLYRSAHFGTLEFEVADPNGEVERTKFAHYLWSSGVLMAELLGRRPRAVDAGDDGFVREEQGKSFDREGPWKEVVEEGGHSDLRSGGDEGGDAEGAAWAPRVFPAERGWWLSREEGACWDMTGHSVLELGAVETSAADEKPRSASRMFLTGVGLAGIISVLAGAHDVVLTDYPAPTILATLRKNVRSNVPERLQGRVRVEAHRWGDFSDGFAASHAGRFSRVIAADTLWLAGEHGNLAASMLHFLSPSQGARILVTAGFHTGRARVARFFEDTVPAMGLEVEDIFEMDANGLRRMWTADAREEGVVERKSWVILARLRRKRHGLEG